MQNGTPSFFMCRAFGWEVIWWLWQATGLLRQSRKELMRCSTVAPKIQISSTDAHPVHQCSRFPRLVYGFDGSWDAKWQHTFLLNSPAEHYARSFSEGDLIFIQISRHRWPNPSPGTRRSNSKLGHGEATSALPWYNVVLIYFSSALQRCNDDSSSWSMMPR